MQAHYIPESSFPLKLASNIFMLGNYFFNLFMITGQKKSALFETGISAVADSVISQLESLDISPDYIIVSHPHSDHITGLPALTEKFPEAEIITAKGAREFITHPKAGPLMIKEDRFMSASLEKFGIRPGRPPLEAVPDLGNALAIDGDTLLDLGGTSLKLVTATGHSPGNLMAVLPEQKILFCSDSIGFHFPGRGFLPLFFTGKDAYLDTLYFIKDFNPSIICPAHQGPLSGKAAVSGIKESLKTTLDLINEIRHSSLPDSELAKKIFQQNYKDEFTLYTEQNISNCASLLVKRAKED